MVSKNWDENKIKECKHCNKFLPLTEEYWISTDVRLKLCKICKKLAISENSKKYHQTEHGKKKALEATKIWRVNNRDKINENKRKYRKKYPDKIKAEKERHFSKPENREKKRLHDKVYFKKNRKKIGKRQREWVKRTPSCKTKGKSFSYGSYGFD